MVERLGLDPVEPRQPVCGVLRVREDLPRLPEARAVRFGDQLAPARVLGRGGEVALGRAEAVVRLAELVDQPDDLVLVPHEVGGELHRDHEIHALPVRLRHVEKPPRERGCQDLGARVPLERKAHEFGLVSKGGDLAHEALRVTLRAAGRERHLRRADEDARHPFPYFTPVTA